MKSSRAPSVEVNVRRHFRYSMLLNILRRARISCVQSDSILCLTYSWNGLMPFWGVRTSQIGSSSAAAKHSPTL